MTRPTLTKGQPGYIWWSTAWYAEANSHVDYTDQITLVIGTHNPLVPNELVSIRWYKLGKGDECARLEAFDDVWDTLYRPGPFRDLLELVCSHNRDEHAQIDKVIALATALDFVDVTETNHPGFSPRHP